MRTGAFSASRFTPVPRPVTYRVVDRRKEAGNEWRKEQISECQTTFELYLVFILFLLLHLAFWIFCHRPVLLVRWRKKTFHRHPEPFTQHIHMICKPFLQRSERPYRQAVWQMTPFSFPSLALAPPHSPWLCQGNQRPSRQLSTHYPSSLPSPHLSGHILYFHIS